MKLAISLHEITRRDRSRIGGKGFALTQNQSVRTLLKHNIHLSILALWKRKFFNIHFPFTFRVISNFICRDTRRKVIVGVGRGSVAFCSIIVINELQ